MQNFHSSLSGSQEIRCKTSPHFFGDTLQFFLKISEKHWIILSQKKFFLLEVFLITEKCWQKQKQVLNNHSSTTYFKTEINIFVKYPFIVCKYYILQFLKAQKLSVNQVPKFYHYFLVRQRGLMWFCKDPSSPSSSNSSAEQSE